MKKGKFKPGHKKLGGRRRGAKNKFGASLKLSFLQAFQDLGGIDGLVAWGRTHKTTFYTLCARLLPQSIEGEFSVAATRHFDADMLSDEDLIKIATRCPANQEKPPELEPPKLEMKWND